MSNSYFQFKQFKVQHDLCAMKVGTDGVLLGAWTTCSDIKRALDIGTGSGLIALMLAQRSSINIDAIDIDKNAIKQAGINFRNSKFAPFLKVYHRDVINYKPNIQYDLIVCNPPFFSNSLPSPDKARTLARHSQSLTLDSLISSSKNLLSESGKLSLILPASAYENIQQIAIGNGFFLTRKSFVSPLKNRSPKRVLLEYSVKDYPIWEYNFFIEKSRHVYSDAFVELTKDFYLSL